jgi:hypothetical protein
LQSFQIVPPCLSSTLNKSAFWNASVDQLFVVFSQQQKLIFEITKLHTSLLQENLKSTMNKYALIVFVSLLFHSSLALRRLGGRYSLAASRKREKDLAESVPQLRRRAQK